MRLISKIKSYRINFTSFIIILKNAYPLEKKETLKQLAGFIRGLI